MTTVRLLADDLTGALDTAAEFSALCGGMEVTFVETWPAGGDRAPPALPPSCAIDTATRERGRDEASAIVARLAPLLRDADIPYKKVDSLLRGPWIAELAACLRLGHWRSCVLAPAFIAQGRRTRGGRQYVLGIDGRWSEVGDNLLSQLAAENLSARPWREGEALSAGVSVFDAESEADLIRAVAVGREAPGPVLWCGSGGLAGALAASAGEVVDTRRLRSPVLGLFGSDHAVTVAQLAAVAPVVVTMAGGAPDAVTVRRRLAGDAVAFVRFGLAPGVARGAAAAQIAAAVASVTASLDPPGTVIVSGGETLKALCLALGAEGLNVTGRVMPGLPRSVFRGGRWAGVEVVSKSGAFGGAALWRDLLNDNGFFQEGSMR